MGEEVRDTVDAEDYQERFVEYFRERIVGGARVLDRAECAAIEGDVPTPQRLSGDNANFSDSLCKLVDLKAAPKGSNNVAWIWSLIGLWLATVAGCILVVV